MDDNWRAFEFSPPCPRGHRHGGDMRDGFPYDLIFFIYIPIIEKKILELILYISLPPMKIPVYTTACLKITLLYHGIFMLCILTYKLKVSNDII